MARAETPEQPSSHGDYVPDAAEYATARAEWRGALGADQDLRRQAIALQVAAEGHRFTYQWEWAGVPIIRLPDDVMVLQELVLGLPATEDRRDRRRSRREHAARCEPHAHGGPRCGRAGDRPQDLPTYP